MHVIRETFLLCPFDSLKEAELRESLHLAENYDGFGGVRACREGVRPLREGREYIGCKECGNHAEIEYGGLTRPGAH